MILITILNLAFCGNFSEGTTGSTCSIGVLDPVYSAFMGFLLVAAFYGIYWLPPLILIQLLISKFSKKSVTTPSVLTIPVTELHRINYKDLKKHWWVYLIILNIGLSYLRDLFL